MKKVNDCIVENCVPTPSSCVTWNGGDIEYLGICNGDSLNNLLWELINKLQKVAGQDLSSFDIDALLDICNQRAPQEITLISILTLVRDNQVCLKDYIDTLNNKLNELFGEQDIDVNLRCYADFDNLGNALSITRKELDQLIIDNLCNHKSRIETLEGKVTNLQSQINNIDTTATVEELNISTCVDSTSKATSLQVISVAEEICDLQDSNGDPLQIATALAKQPGDWNTKFGLIAGWDLTPDNWAQQYGNALLVIANLISRIELIEDNCCAVTCKDVELGFTAVFNETMDGVIIKFTSGAGTYIPIGFTDQGSTGVITDKNGNTETFTLAIANNYEIEVPVTGLDLTGDLTIEITAILGTGDLTCQKCLTKVVKTDGCGICTITVTGDPEATVVLVYDDNVVGAIINPPPTTTTTTTTTTTSSTTTTTTAP